MIKYILAVEQLHNKGSMYLVFTKLWYWIKNTLMIIASKFDKILTADSSKFQLLLFIFYYKIF